MPRTRIQSESSNADPRLNRTLWQCLVLGALAVTLFPAARGYGLWLGWLPFWALIAPLSSLLVLHRHLLTAAWRTVLVRAPRRRHTRSTNAQAGRQSFGPSSRRKLQRAA